MAREDLTHSELTDHELTHLVMEAISQDSHVPIAKVRVTVEDGDIFLSGIVDSLAEKNAAEEDAKRIPGITQIINMMVVRPEHEVSGRDIEQNAMKALREDGRVSAGHYEVTSKDKVVILRGEAATAVEKRAAVDDVCSTYGVAEIVDQVIVLPQSEPGDHMLEEQVTEALGRVPELDAKRIHAHVQDRVVHLKGTVDLAQQIAYVERAAKSVPGVRDVKNEIVVAMRG